MYLIFSLVEVVGLLCILVNVSGNIFFFPITSRIVEIERYSSLPFHPINDGHCDVIVDKPTYFMKLDASKSSADADNLVMYFSKRRE